MSNTAIAMDGQSVVTPTALSWQFIRWGLGLFITGFLTGFIPIAHYMVGAIAGDVGPDFLRNITLWWGCPAVLAELTLKTGGLGMIAIGLCYQAIIRQRLDDPQSLSCGHAIKSATSSRMAVARRTLAGHWVGRRNRGRCALVLFWDANDMPLSGGTPTGRQINGGDTMESSNRETKSPLKTSRRSFTNGTIAAGFAAASGASMIVPAKAESLSPTEAQKIGEDAYVYGYSLITTEVTRVQMSNVPKVDAYKAPMGQFINVPKYPAADVRVISAPNADTLYSMSWLDLAEPQAFSHPDMGSRFYLFEITDLWMTDSESSPSKRTASGKAANYLFTQPGWKGEVPAGMKHIPMATRYMIILGRTYADGTEEDYKAVNALQAQLKVTPLSAWGKPYTPVAPAVDPNPGFSMSDKPQPVITAMGTEGYFNMMARLMGGAAPPAAGDAPMLASMAKLGIVPGKPFEMSKLDPAVQAALKDIPQSALKKIEANKNITGAMVNGWVVTKGLGTYGPGDYLKRAVVAAFGWPANQEKDAVYPYTEVDSTGKTLTGANKYTVTFAKDATPPVDGFWSITMYEIDEGWWFTPNALNKYTVSPRDNPKPNTDGSLTLYFQNESPGKDKEANWLPSPKGEFIPMLRMYWPKETSPSILNGSWKVPPVVKVS